MGNLPMSKRLTHQLGRLALALATASLFLTPASPALAQATCRAQAVTVNLNQGQMPSSSTDVILGTPGDDIICVGEGDDQFNCGTTGGADFADGRPHMIGNTLGPNHDCEVWINIP